MDQTLITPREECQSTSRAEPAVVAVTPPDPAPAREKPRLTLQQRAKGLAALKAAKENVLRELQEKEAAEEAERRAKQTAEAKRIDDFQKRIDEWLVKEQQFEQHVLPLQAEAKETLELKARLGQEKLADFLKSEWSDGYSWEEFMASFEEDISQLEAEDQMTTREGPHVPWRVLACQFAFAVSECKTLEQLEQCAKTWLDKEVIVRNGKSYSAHPRFNAMIDDQGKESSLYIRNIQDRERLRVMTKINDAIRSQLKKLGAEDKQKDLTNRKRTLDNARKLDNAMPVLEVFNLQRNGTCTAMIRRLTVRFEASLFNFRLIELTGSKELESHFQILKKLEETCGVAVEVPRAILIQNGELVGEIPQLNAPQEVPPAHRQAWSNEAKFVARVVTEGIRRRKIPDPPELTPRQFHKESALGVYSPKTEKTEKFRAFVYEDRRSGEETSLHDARLKVERFLGLEWEEPRIRVVEVNPKHKKLFERCGCLEPEGFPDDQDHFGGLPIPLRPILKADYGRHDYFNGKANGKTVKIG